jgi:hypothetical protein
VADVEKLSNELVRGLDAGLTEYCGHSRLAMLRLEAGVVSPFVITNEGGWPTALIRDDQLFSETIHAITRLLHRSNKPGHDELNIIAHSAFSGLLLPENVIVFGCYSDRTPLLIWFLEKNSNVESRAIFKHWFSEACNLFDLYRRTTVGRQQATNVWLQISSYAIPAARLVLEPYLTSYTEQHPLDLCIALTTALEEGRLANGKIVFISSEAELSSLSFVVPFANNRPSLPDVKHIRKLLTAVDNSEFSLIATPHAIQGVAKVDDAQEYLRANFANGSADMFIGNEYQFSIHNGKLRSYRRRPNFLVLEKSFNALNVRKAFMPNYRQQIEALLSTVFESNFGCLLVLGDDDTQSLSGQALTIPLSIFDNDHLRLISNMAKVDGATHVNSQGKAFKFASLLGGSASVRDVAARGARFNSASRYSRENSDQLVVALSVDGGLSCFIAGELII